MTKQDGMHELMQDLAMRKCSITLQIQNYYQSTSKAYAKVLQSLKVYCDKLAQTGPR